MYKRISILMVLLTIVLTVFVSCGFNTDNKIPPVDNNTTEQASDVTIEESDNNSAQHVSGEQGYGASNKLKIIQRVFEEDAEESIFGIWSLDKIVLVSENYSGEYKWNGMIYNRENYIGYEVEYSPDFFRLGQDIYYNPDYEVWDFNLYTYNNEGDFLNPDLYDLIEAENIIVDRSDEFESIEDVPLRYFIIWTDEEREEDIYIPVGTQCVMLNEDTMLVGVWGHVILANRVTD